MSHPKILLIYTGGTIGSLPADKDNPASPLDARPFTETLEYEYCRGLEDRMRQVGGGLDFDLVNVSPPIDSSRIRPDKWIVLARIIELKYADYDGFVLLHGTDTMAMTATAEAAARPTSSLPAATGSPGSVASELTVKISEVIGAGQAEQERVVITNLGEQLADMQGWILSDGQGNTYTFPNIRLWPGGNVTVHTHGGEDGSPVNNFYWSSPVALWLPGRVVTLTDAAGNLVSSYTVEP